jgi:hypothetical protein
VVSFEPATSPAPGTTLGPIDQAELLGQRRGVSSRARPDPPGSKQVSADLQVPAKTGDLGVLTVPANLLHDTSPSRFPFSLPIATRATTVPTPSAESNAGASDHVLDVLWLAQRYQLMAKVGPSPRPSRIDCSFSLKLDSEVFIDQMNGGDCAEYPAPIWGRGPADGSCKIANSTPAVVRGID